MQVSPACVINPGVVRGLRFVKSRMLDVIESGDSLLASGGGFQMGNEYAVAPRSCGGLGYMGGIVYGTALLSAGMNGMNSYAIGHGLTLQQGGISATGAINGAPAANETFFSPQDYAETLGTPGYAYITGSTVATAQFGLATGAHGAFSLPFSEPWRFVTRHGKFAAGTNCRPIGRMFTSPYTIQAGFENALMDFAGTAGATELQTRAISQAAVEACASGGMQVLLSGNVGSLIGASGASPAMLYWMRLLRNQTRGLSFSPLVDKAGKTVLDHYNALNAMPNAQFANFLADLLAHQTAAGQTEKIMIYIEGGPNDASSVQMSLDGVNGQSTKAGFKYTLRDYVRLWRTKLTNAVLSGAPIAMGDPSNTTIALIGPHVVEDSTRQTAYTNYSDAMNEIAQEAEFSAFTWAWDWRKCMSTAEARANSWYANVVSDQVHLSSAGNKAMSGHLWRTLDEIAFGSASRLDRTGRAVRVARP